jgi:hypothetical protein
MEAEKFVNLSKKRAQDLAEANYMIFRLISVDGEPFFSYPEDIRTDRIWRSSSELPSPKGGGF